MPLQRFLIAPFNSGIITYLKPWLTPDDSFVELYNAHVFRGRIEKRWGISYMEYTDDDLLSRLRINIGTTDGDGDLPPVTVPGPAGTIGIVGSQFSVGDGLFLVEVTGAADMLSTGPGTGTYNTANREVTILGAQPDTDVYYYPTLPVMGLTQYNDASTVNFSPTIAFDKYFSYVYGGSAQGFQRLGPGSFWTGGSTNFMWNRMFANTNPDEEWLFALNNKPFPVGILDDMMTLSSDGIKYRADAVPANNWINFCPLVRYVTTPDALRMTGGLCAIEFKGRLLVFAPWEANDSTYTGDPTDPITLGASTQIVNRVRYSWEFSLDKATNPLFLSQCFFEASGKGGYIDAPTAQNIVTVQFVKDRLIVYFESSTFELVYVGSPDAPFAWQKLDTTLGAESTFSQIAMDDAVFGVGSNGIHACNGANVVRIDEKIPDEVFMALNEFTNHESSLNSICGIRDYLKEMIYWTFPQRSQLGDFPNHILVYDYKNKNWAKYSDTYTFFGYHDALEGLIWASWHTPWESSNDPWNTPSTIRNTQNIIAGNQQGFVVMIDREKSRLAPALIISLLVDNLITCVNHNLQQGDFVQISGATGSTNLNGVTIQVFEVLSEDIFTFITPDGSVATGDYTGGGLLERVCNVELLTKQFNFFTNTGQQTYIPYIEFLVDRTANFNDEAGNALMGGRHTIDYFVGSASYSMLQASGPQGTNAIMGTNILETSPYLVQVGNISIPDPMEATQDRLWHRIYFQANNDLIQLRLFYTDEQMFDVRIPFTDFALHAMLIYADATSSRIAG